MSKLYIFLGVTLPFLYVPFLIKWSMFFPVQLMWRVFYQSILLLCNVSSYFYKNLVDDSINNVDKNFAIQNYLKSDLFKVLSFLCNIKDLMNNWHFQYWDAIHLYWNLN